MLSNSTPFYGIAILPIFDRTVCTVWRLSLDVKTQDLVREGAYLDANPVPYHLFHDGGWRGRENSYLICSA